MHKVQLRVIRRAAELIGGPEHFATFLEVPRERVQIWLQGDVPIPINVFLRSVDFVLDHGVAHSDIKVPEQRQYLD